MMLTFESVSDKEVQRNPETRKWGLWIMEYCISHLFYDSFVLFWFLLVFFLLGCGLMGWGNYACLGFFWSCEVQIEMVLHFMVCL